MAIQHYGQDGLIELELSRLIYNRAGIPGVEPA
jgi:hypothetical protein